SQPVPATQAKNIHGCTHYRLTRTGVQQTTRTLPGLFRIPPAPLTSNQCLHRTGKKIKMTSEELLGNAALKSWNQVLGRFNKEIAALTDEQFQKRVAPGKNRLFYLLGHLTAVHDRLLPML